VTTTGLANIDLRHGYTLRDVYQLTRAAVLADRSGAMPYRDRWDTAWSAVVTALYEADEPPQRSALIRQGWYAIYAEVRDGRRHAGYRDREFDAGHASAPGFVQFWTNPHSDFCDELVDGMAVTQIVATLKPHLADAVTALAVCDDYAAAAAALGLRYSTLTVRLSEARRTFLRLWHEGERPSAVRGTDRRIGRRVA
jgi:hypothetical protein